ncbi:hypothetical protein EJB05_45646, partial [Eragrostis curvula]
MHQPTPCCRICGQRWQASPEDVLVKSEPGGSDSPLFCAARQLLQGIVTPSRERAFAAAKPFDVIDSTYMRSSRFSTLIKPMPVRTY